MRDLSPVEAEGISFVPSAMSIPKALRFGQFASVVVDDGKEAYTVNLCQQCHNESLTVKGLALLKNWQWKAVVEKKAHRGRLWRTLGKDQSIQGMCEYFSLERVKAKKKFSKDAEKEKQEGIQGQWQT